MNEFEIAEKQAADHARQLVSVHVERYAEDGDRRPAMLAALSLALEDECKAQGVVMEICFKGIDMVMLIGVGLANRL